MGVVCLRKDASVSSHLIALLALPAPAIVTIAVVALLRGERKDTAKVVLALAELVRAIRRR